MDKSEKRSYKRIEELDTHGVIDLLKRWEMTEFLEFCMEKEIDGRKLLNITEGVIKLWRPKINANKLIFFIEDLKSNPVKYLKELNESYDIVLRKENIELKTLNIKFEKEVISTNMDTVTNIEKDAVRKDVMENNLDIETQYQTVRKEKVKESQSNLSNVEEIIKRIVPAKSFLYRNQVKKESTPSYLPMDGSPKRKRLFRLSGYEYPIFDLKRFSKPENTDRGYYPMKRNSRFFVSKTKPESRTKYKSISTTEELKYPEDHFYEDLCYTDIDKPRSSISSNQTVKPYRVKIQELFQSFKIPFFKRNEEEEKEIEQSEEKIVERVEEKKIIVEREHVYENSDSISNMYDSVQAPVPISENKVKQSTHLPVEDYLEPCQLNKDYCDVNYRQKEDSILGYILSIFENRLGFWRETSESATENSDDISHRTAEEKKWSEEKKGPKANMADRPLPVPVENEPYYMNIERTEAENLLKGQPNGTFLLRPSSQPNHAYTLSVSCNDAVHNIGVRRRPDGRMSLGFARRGERSFPDVTALLRHHKKRRLLLVAHGEVIGATTLNESPQYYQTPCNIPVRHC